jgi:hypothetical protein
MVLVFSLVYPPAHFACVSSSSVSTCSLKGYLSSLYKKKPFGLVCYAEIVDEWWSVAMENPAFSVTCTLAGL